jgi:hypothetical protein
MGNALAGLFGGSKVAGQFGGSIWRVQSGGSIWRVCSKERKQVGYSRSQKKSKVIAKRGRRAFIIL